MAVWFLDNDDEITDAVARLRGTSDTRVVFVVPPGSRIATGRINFKLLAREASSRDLEMAVASPDEQVRTLAMAAGVLALPSADEAEAALERGDSAPRPDDGGVATAAGAGADEAIPAASAMEAAARVRRRRLSIAVFVVLALVVAGGVFSLETLPTADITLAPRRITVGPIEVRVEALTSIAEPDLEARRVPAVEIPIPLQVEGVFGSSGSESMESRALGEVVFSSSEQSFDQDIVAGTRVETPAGVAFQTMSAVVLPRPENGSGASLVSAPVEAIEPGPDGNVPPRTITVVPSLASQGIGVTNPEATTGGQLQETAIVTRQDYDAAAVDLQNRLAGEMATRLRDPGSVPEGLTLFPETAQLGPIRHEPAAEDVVGTATDEFSLSAFASARALGVDAGAVEAVALSSLDREVPSGMALIPGSVGADAGAGAADGQRIEFRSSAAGDAVVLVDADALLAQIAGLPVSEAQAILEALGTATVNVWPDFLGDLPNDQNRITLELQEPSGTE